MSHDKTYQAYKNSGVEWLGRVPEHWVTKKLLYWISGYGSGTTPSKEDEYSADGLPWVTTGELRENTVSSTEKCVTQDALKNNSALKLHPAGSLVIAMYGATVGRLGVLGVNATLNQACFAIHPSEKVRIPFLRNWFEGFRNELLALATGAGQPNISGDKIRNLLLPCPEDLSEQLAIITHLDRETARIDALVEKKTRFIELLREKRQALITHAVTKGLDPSAKMKESGVEWLGEVPEHWDVSPVRYAVKAQAGAIKTGPFGSQLTASEMLGGYHKVYNQKNVIEGDLSSGDNYISDEKFSQLSSFRVFPGDVLVTTRGTIGRVCVAPDDIELGILHPCLMRVQLDEAKMKNEFFATLLGESHILQSQISYLSNASTIEVIYSETMASLVVPIPPLNEQRSILYFIQTHASKLDSLIRTSERSIVLLKERRSALITAAVTGQIDLREAV
ncbi:restriction endonuclease subunit S [Pseudomonas sp. BN417]|uniref:restriction endonuclease subunit S n=1 Tax=Pseudomonas sp. BN417 TaxID=2567890 RepID=UPI0024558949|nr:restriction endonuclease subunit S [Pseudomonas sp. BN417]MDH4557807.1 restriction endonuclease subunit S [Pseudomonas sp. BN417]